MPLIAISACRKIEDYKQSILHVGGEVRMVDASMRVDDALAALQGLLLTGGDDVAPSRYGESPHPAIVEAEAGRDEFEIGLIAAARKRDLPIFAICRGIQVLNVACGGTLVQDIPSQVHGALPHSLPAPPHESYELAHEVWLDKDTLLTRLMRERLERHRRVRSEQPASSGREGLAARLARLGHGARRRHRGDRGSRRHASASASSGTRRISGAPASSARCSKGSSKPPRTPRSRRRLDVQHPYSFQHTVHFNIRT